MLMVCEWEITKEMQINRPYLRLLNASIKIWEIVDTYSVGLRLDCDAKNFKKLKIMCDPFVQ